MDAAAYFFSGIEKRRTGDLEGAIEDYSKAIDIEIESNTFGLHEIYSFRGCAKLELNNIDGAIQDYLKAIEVEPTHTLAYMWLGKVYCNRKEFAKAAGYIDKVVGIFGFTGDIDDINDDLLQDYSEEEWNEIKKYLKQNE